MLTPKQRLLYALAGATIDRAPVVCLGGPMSAAVSEVLAAEHLDFGSLHTDPEKLAQAALAVARRTGFECVGLPLCATVEAEALGSPIEPASATTEPRVVKERYGTLAEVGDIDIEAALTGGQVPALLEAVAIASDEAGGLPVVVNVLGPFTLAGSVIEPTALLRGVLESSEHLHALLDQLASFLVKLVGRLAVLGADVVTIHEDMGDPKSIGLKRFDAVTVPHLERLVTELKGSRTPVATAGHVPFCVCPACRVTTALEAKRRSIPVILHCCELTEASWSRLPRIGANAVSVGNATNVESLLAKEPDLVVIGNVSTHLLDRGSAEQVRKQAARAVASGVRVLAPECGLAMSTPLANIKAVVQAVHADSAADATVEWQAEAGT
jgi:[methyl-Co(III) methanol-specific corrinoid protein]:coenzyme M methyltransferase